MKKLMSAVLVLISWPGAAFIVLFRPAGRAIDVVANLFLGLKKESDD